MPATACKEREFCLTASAAACEAAAAYSQCVSAGNTMSHRLSRVAGDRFATSPDLLSPVSRLGDRVVVFNPVRRTGLGSITRFGVEFNSPATSCKTASHRLRKPGAPHHSDQPAGDRFAKSGVAALNLLLICRAFSSSGYRDNNTPIQVTASPARVALTINGTATGKRTWARSGFIRCLNEVAFCRQPNRCLQSQMRLSQ